jgi:hypothetical protein
MFQGAAVVITVVFLGGCHLFDDYEETKTVVLYFNETNVAIFEGGLGSLSVRVDPVETLEYYDIAYSISNEEVAVIFQADNRGVVFSGKAAGSTVLTAKLQGAEAKSVITVYRYEE